MLEVLEPGLLSTVQDAGRPGFAHLGVPVSGACDPLGLAVANLLLGNPPVAPALEMTLAGPTLRAVEDCVVAFAGADFEAQHDGTPVRPGASRLLRAGAILRFGPARRGSRGYLALTGGISLPLVLGSASTYLPARLGGIEGRALRAGDRLVPGLRGDLSGAGRSWPSGSSGPQVASRRLRLLPGPHPEAFADGAFEALLASEWTVHARSDRTGLRLARPLQGPGGTAGQRPAALTSGGLAGEMVSQPMTWGAVQVPPDGEPILLQADHQTIGGYPVLAVVIRADRTVLGQLAPGERVRLVPATIGDAQRAYREQQARLRRIAAQFDRRRSPA
jgi:antagonist of KipI